MIQDIIVYIILLSAVIYTIYTVVKTVTTKEDTLCGDCFSCGIPELNKPEKEKGWKRINLLSKQG